MNIFKKILGHIYFVYGLLLFVITMFIVFIPLWIISLLPEPKRAKSLHVAFRIWMGIFLPLIFCPVFRRGKKNFKNGENYVVVVNHNSLVDIPVSSPWIPGPNKTLAKIEMAKTPIFGVIYRAGSIIVDRKSENSRRDSLKEMLDTLNKGVNLCLYPEGTRNKSGKPIQPFFDGAFVAAIKSQKPIIPGIIFNTAKILPHNAKFWAIPKPIYFDFLEPIPTKGLTLNDTATLKASVHKIMEEYYVANNK